MTVTSREQKKDRGGARIRRDAMLDEAARQFNAGGVSLTSFAQLANTLGISRAALYYYFQDREDLVFQVYCRSCELMARHLGEAARSGRSALQAVEAFVRHCLAGDAPEMAALTEFGLLGESERETVLGLYEGLVARMARLLESGARDGLVRQADHAIIARGIIGVVHWAPLVLHWGGRFRPTDRAEIADTIIDIVLNGLAAEAARPLMPLDLDLTPLLPEPIQVFERGRIAAAKRESILVTASRLFNRKGVDTTSLDTLASELKATKRTLYHHVGDKQAVVAACYSRSTAIHLFVYTSAAALSCRRIDAAAAASRASVLSQMLPQLEPLRPFVGFDALGSADRRAIDGQTAELAAAAGRPLRMAAEEGDLRAVDIDEVLLLLPGFPSWLAKGLITVHELDRPRIAAEISNLIFLGIRQFVSI